MRYFVTANDSDREATWRERLADHGFDVAEEYDEDALIITIGGDGSILWTARHYDSPTILPVRAGQSEGLRTSLDVDDLLESLEAVETGEKSFSRQTFDRVTASQDGDELRGDFTALNEISLHHRSPVLGAVFAVRIHDQGQTHEFEKVIGDGVLVATSFGSTGYYRSITGGTFERGLGVAFNNVHNPQGIPIYKVCSPDAVVELELLKTTRSSGAVLTRDDEKEMFELAAREPIEIRRASVGVDILDIE